MTDNSVFGDCMYDLPASYLLILFHIKSIC